jgi:hypothetical protein
MIRLALGKTLNDKRLKSDSRYAAGWRDGDLYGQRR